MSDQVPKSDATELKALEITLRTEREKNNYALNALALQKRELEVENRVLRGIIKDLFNRAFNVENGA